MPGRKIAESLTARIFLITVLILLCAGGVTFGLIAWATPITYTSVINDDLTRQLDALAGRLEDSSFEDCGPLLDEFIRSSGADAMLADQEGRVVDTGSQLAVRPLREEGSTAVTSVVGEGAIAEGSPTEAGDAASGDSQTGADSAVADGSPTEAGGAASGSSQTGADSAVADSSAAAAGGSAPDDSQTEGSSAAVYATDRGTADGDGTVTVTMSGDSAITRSVRFADRDGVYSLSVTPRAEAENLAVQALKQIAPWLLLLLVMFSLLCALVYSRYITRPIVRLSGAAGRMAELDFGWKCEEQRRDEIGALGRSLNQMARRLSAALNELEAANRALRGEMEQEREMERQRTAFFSAASHELKTPVTILKGQLTGMLEGVDVYRDRDKYLLRSLRVAGRMEKLIQEMLAISRMESGTAAVERKPVELAALLEQQLALHDELLKQRGQRLASALTPGITVEGDASLLEKAVGNLLSHASLYSPEGADIRVWCGEAQGCAVLTVENTGVRIGEEALPHLFEAFYREDRSRNSRTGGSGLGLYLVRMILERHGARCDIENTPEGVKATVRFEH